MKIIKFLFRLVGSNKCAKIIHEKIPLKLSAAGMIPINRDFVAPYSRNSTNTLSVSLLLCG